MRALTVQPTWIPPRCGRIPQASLPTVKTDLRDAAALQSNGNRCWPGSDQNKFLLQGGIELICI